jgi:hypothetical protein
MDNNQCEICHNEDVATHSCHQCTAICRGCEGCLAIHVMLFHEKKGNLDNKKEKK